MIYYCLFSTSITLRLQTNRPIGCTKGQSLQIYIQIPNYIHQPHIYDDIHVGIFPKTLLTSQSVNDDKSKGKHSPVTRLCRLHAFVYLMFHLSTTLLLLPDGHIIVDIHSLHWCYHINILIPHSHTYSEYYSCLNNFLEQLLLQLSKLNISLVSYMLSTISTKRQEGPN